MAKERVDVLAYKQGLFDTREQAKRGVMAGLVVAVINGERFDKPGEKIDEATELKLKGEKLKYVSRGGLKLEKALNHFGLSVEGKIAIDIGASTGGFTDVMLQNGASQVFSVDVGTNQLAWKLRNDPRVVSMEQFNFRYAEPDDFEALGKTPQKDLVAEKSTYPALLGLEESKALLTSELDACEDLLDQITVACDFDPQAIKKLIEGLRIDG